MPEFLNRPISRDVGKIANFSQTFEEIEVFAKNFTNFILCREILGRSKIDFCRDYQQILKKHKKVFHENYQREFSVNF